MTAPMKKVYIAGNPIDAKLAKDFLESAGIEARVRGEYLFPLRGGVPMTAETLPAVLVAEEDYERARWLLDRLESRSRLESVEPEAVAEDCGEEGDGRERSAR
jgi:hypothetical protein